MKYYSILTHYPIWITLSPKDAFMKMAEEQYDSEQEQEKQASSAKESGAGWDPGTARRKNKKAAPKGGRKDFIMNNEEKILQMLTEMRSDIAELKATQAEQGKQLDRLEATQVEQGKQLDKLEATQVEQGKLLEEVDQRSIRTQVLLETDISDQLKLALNGHSLIMEKMDELAPKSRVEVLEDDVAMMKDVIKLMRQEIAELKKAQ